MAQPYHLMIIESSEIPVRYNIAAAAASWTMLAGFFTFPGTFTSLERSQALVNSPIVHTVANVPLLVVASLCYAMGVAGFCFLWSKFRTNYVWLLAHLFL